MTAPVWTLDESSYNMWLMASSDYYSLLGISATANESEINTAYRRHALGCHPDKIPSSDSDEVRNAKTKRFRTLVDAKNTLLDPERRAAYDKAPKDTISEPSMSLTEAYKVWAAAVLSAFKRSNWVKLVGSLGIPALIIAMGGGEVGGRLCMTFALLLAQDSLSDELNNMSVDDLYIFRHAVLVLANNM